MAISNTVLTTIPANIYVSSGNTVVSVMYFCNTDSSARNLNVYAVPAASAGFAANANVQIYKNIQIASGDTYVVDMEKLVLQNGDQIRANTSSNISIISTVSYVGI